MKKITVLTGAGISAESGLGTFRGNNGLWDNYKIEEVATPKAWINNQKLVLDFYNLRRKLNQMAEPNAAHNALNKLEKYYDVTIITQNIDDLHERAKSSKILHLHGEIMKAKTFELSQEYYSVVDDIKIGDKGKDGKQLRPHVVWFGESVPEMINAERIIKTADVLIVIGTSLNVYPAANLVHLTKHNCEKFIIDPNEVNQISNMHHIKENATIAVPVLVEDLNNRAKK